MIRNKAAEWADTLNMMTIQYVKQELEIIVVFGEELIKQLRTRCGNADQLTVSRRGVAKIIIVSGDCF